MLAQSLSGPDAKYSGPAVKSVRSRVTTISRHLPSSITLAGFEAALLGAVFASDTPYRRYDLSLTDQQSIETLADKRYRDPKWTYANIPDYSQKHQKNICRRQRASAAERTKQLDNSVQNLW